MQSLVAISLTLILAAAFAGAQKPHPCKSPPLMAGKISALNPKGQVAIYERFSYDALERRIRVGALVFVDNSTENIEVLMLFREGVLYEIFYQNQTCKKSELKEAFQPIEIPHDAQLLGQQILGSSSVPGSGLLVNSWQKSMPEIETNFFMTFTEFACIPVSIVSYAEITGWTMTSFYDIVIGIEDPDEFIPPPFCEKAELSHKSAKSFFNFLAWK